MAVQSSLLLLFAVHCLDVVAAAVETPRHFNTALRNKTTAILQQCRQQQQQLMNVPHSMLQNGCLIAEFIYK
jgi:hypothetical protein